MNVKIHGYGNQQPSEGFMKKCTNCGENKALSEFYFKPARGVYEARCKACIKVANRKYYKANRKHIIDSNKQWRNDNRVKYLGYLKDYSKIRTAELKQAALDIIGNKCACCGEDNQAFLTIDHVNNDGHIHRREINQRNIYEWLSNNNYKSDYELQTLCFNCNFAKRYNGGVCPHETLEGSETIETAKAGSRVESSDSKCEASH